MTKIKKIIIKSEINYQRYLLLSNIDSLFLLIYKISYNLILIIND